MNGISQLTRLGRGLPAVTAAVLLGLPAVHASAADAARAWPNVRPLTDRTFERTPERRERGRYLVEGLLQCVVCHSERDWSKPGAPPVPGREAAGVVWSERGERRLVAPNLTPDVETGAGRWTDDMLARAIREGVSHDGRPLHQQMWYGSFRALHDEDLASVIVYLRSLPPVRNPLPPTRLPDAELLRLGAQLKPLTSPVPPPAGGSAVDRGRYLLAVADCAGCHTSWHTKRMPGLYGGGNDVRREGRGAFSANLTPDPTGMLYGPETFAAVMRTGRWGTLDAAMPWIAFRHLDDADLHDMHSALASGAPVAHAVNNAEPPTACAVCGGTHGGGERNVVARPPAAAVPASTLQRYVGRYRFAEYDEVVDVEWSDGRLWYVGAGQRLAMTPTTPTRFHVDGGLFPVEFDVAADGPPRAFVAVGVWPDRYERVERGAESAAR
jgi:mono/diheme cytochrome c family protein